MEQDDDQQDSHCLSDKLLARLMDSQLAAEELSRVRRHCAECAACRALLITIVRGGSRLEKGRENLSQPEPPAGGWTPPETFDEFRLVDMLGRGAMGVVYLAHDQKLDRQVAVKFIAAHQPSEQARERFQHEAIAIARVRHPNVVTVFRTGEADGHPYIVSEYLVGQSLAELALPLPWRRALGLGIGLARGLAAAHLQGVLHRDLKPSNVLLTAAGEVKLLDFGLAELVDVHSPSGPQRARVVAGTPRYMAPELFHGAPATPQADLYALGLILYELCTGTLPPQAHRELSPSPDGQSVPGLAGDLGEGHPPLLSEQVPGIDPGFASLIERCLLREPRERFASAEALCAELERLGRLHEPDVLAAGSPYRGLAPFEAEHRAHFFGRDADIRAVLERLRRQSLILVVGGSGVGKSSLCRAGILPRVAQGVLDEFRDFTSLTLEPGRRPLAALAAALAPVLGQAEDELRARLAEEPESLGPALRTAFQQERGLLLFVDQLEELLTVSEPTEAVSFARLLGELALPAAGVRVLLAARADFLARIGELPGLGGEVERALYLLRPLTSVAVREAITGPARSRGVVFESEALVHALAEATAQGAGSLPLLQFTLAELWERRDIGRGCITQAALDELGGVAGALSRHADGVITQLGRAEQQAARRLLGRLITAEGTRTTRTEEELTAASAEAHTALRALVEGRLLYARTEGGQASYEIAHEALIASWGTLRNWMAEDASQRVVRQRLEAAGAEWERLGRAEELLWRGQQLDEARVIDPATLGVRERDFLEASRRAARRQLVRRWLAILILVLTVGGTYGVLRLQAHMETLRIVQARMEEAQAALSRGRALGQRASARREQALELFDGRGPRGSSGTPNPQEIWLRAETVWALALTDLKGADAAFAEAESALDDALDRAHGHAGIRRHLIELTYERILLAETFHLKDERARLEQRFERLAATDPEWQGRLDTPAMLELVTTPPGASVEITRYMEDDKGGLRQEPVPGLGPLSPTPIAQTSLRAGSYHLRITREGHAPVDLPLLLERGQHESVHLVLPDTVPRGYVYIPPGAFLEGSADQDDVRRFLRSAPLRRARLDEGFVIGQTEVTVSDWMAYLQSLPEGAAQRRLLASLPDGIGGMELTQAAPPGGNWRFALRLESGRRLDVSAGQNILYPGRSHHQEQDWRLFPLTGVSAEDFKGYLDWLDRTGRLPGARLCNELEWTRAARGADDRRYPHGNRLESDDANIDMTYGIRRDARGPDAVRAHPESVSPFGLFDMAGNAFEITEPVTRDLDELVIRGGSWYYSSVSTSVANRQSFKWKLRDARVGFRVCATFPVP